MLKKITVIFALILFSLASVLTKNNHVNPRFLLNQKQSNNQARQNSQKLNALTNEEKEKQIATQDFTEIEQKLVDPLAEENSEDFFQIYQKEEALITNNYEEEKNLRQMGEIFALKISGLKLAGDNLKIHELEIRDTNRTEENGNKGNVVAYNVAYLRAFNTNINLENENNGMQPDPIPGELAKINDQDLDTYLEVKNVKSPQAIEINILLNKPTTLSNINIAFDASDSLPESLASKAILILLLMLVIQAMNGIKLGPFNF